jgi:hypothetical protein
MNKIAKGISYAMAQIISRGIQLFAVLENAIIPSILKVHVLAAFAGSECE